MRFLVLVAVFALSACTSHIQKPEAPDDLIERDSMVVILRELVVLEAHVELRYQQVTNYYKIMSASGKACLKRYNVSPERFDRSYDYYVSRQQELQSIYSEVLDSLNREVNQLQVQSGLEPDTSAKIPDVVKPFEDD